LQKEADILHHVVRAGVARSQGIYQAVC
jgi:hypothetical protein